MADIIFTLLSLLLCL